MDDRPRGNQRRGATTILRIAADGTLGVHRTGAHDAGLSAEEYLRGLAASEAAKLKPPYQL